MSTIVAFGAVLAVVALNGATFFMVSASRSARNKREAEKRNKLTALRPPRSEKFISARNAEDFIGKVSVAAGGALQPVPLRLRDLIHDLWHNHQDESEFIKQVITLLRLYPGAIDQFVGLLPNGYNILFPVKGFPVEIVIITTPAGGLIHHTSESLAGKLYETGPLTTQELRSKLASEPEEWRSLIAIQPPWTICLSQLLQIELDAAVLDERSMRNALRLLRDICKVHGVLPPSVLLSEVNIRSRKPLAGGGFADVYSGFLGDRMVCLKVLRIFLEESERQKIFKQFSHEALLWRQLRHSNVLEFLGVNTDLFEPSYCLISPFMKNGNIMEFLKARPHHDRITSFMEITEGLIYLHSHNPQIIHGDIRGANILVNDKDQCCIADFGLSIAAETESFDTSSTASRGATRWLAPEVIAPSMFPSTNPRSTARDIYALGCTILEMSTGKPPFSEHRMDSAVMMSVLNGIRPERPRELSAHSFDELWTLIQLCWETQPTMRPHVYAVKDVLQHLKIVKHNHIS